MMHSGSKEKSRKKQDFYEEKTLVSDWSRVWQGPCQVQDEERKGSANSGSLKMSQLKVLTQECTIQNTNYLFPAIPLLNLVIPYRAPFPQDCQRAAQRCSQATILKYAWGMANFSRLNGVFCTLLKMIHVQWIKEMHKENLVPWQVLSKAVGMAMQGAIHHRRVLAVVSDAQWSSPAAFQTGVLSFRASASSVTGCLTVDFCHDFSCASSRALLLT